MRAALWDLDGTLLQSTRSIRTTMDHILHERGLPRFSQAELEGLIGNPLRDILRKRTDDEEAIEAMVHRYRSVYNAYAWVFVELYPDVEATLVQLTAKGVRHAVVTTKGEAEAEALLDDMGLLHHFDTVVGDDDVRPLKPDPAPVREACARLDISPSDATMIGDTPFDIGAGQAAGVRTMGVTWGHCDAETLRKAGAQVLVSQMREIPAYWP